MIERKDLDDRDHIKSGMEDQTAIFEHLDEKTPLYAQGSGDVDEVAMNDVNQNQIGDCWLLGPLAEMALKNPQAIKNMIHDNGDGTYTVTFKERVGISPIYIDKKITVTPEMPWDSILEIGGESKFHQPHAGKGDKNFFGKEEIWVQIIEKAYAEYKGGYDKINTNTNPSMFMEAITGRPSTQYNPNFPGTLLSNFNPPESNFTFEILQAQFNTGSPVVFCTKKDLS